MMTKPVFFHINWIRYIKNSRNLPFLCMCRFLSIHFLPLVSLSLQLLKEWYIHKTFTTDRPESILRSLPASNLVVWCPQLLVHCKFRQPWWGERMMRRIPFYQKTNLLLSYSMLKNTVVYYVKEYRKDNSWMLKR